MHLYNISLYKYNYERVFFTSYNFRFHRRKTMYSECNENIVKIKTGHVLRVIFISGIQLINV